MHIYTQVSGQQLSILQYNSISWVTTKQTTIQLAYNNEAVNNVFWRSAPSGYKWKRFGKQLKLGSV
jgi:hypothetical protein